MKVDSEKIDQNKMKLDVEVEVEEVGKAIKAAYVEISQNAEIDGFRKGKIPPKVIDAKIGKETVHEEAKKQLTNVSYTKAIAESGIKPIDNPEIDIKQFEEGKPFKFSVEVEVQPEFELPPYEVAEAEKKKVEITEQELNEQVNNLRERFAELEPIKTRPARQGDFALISFTGFVNGKEVEKASMQDYLVEIGSNTLMPPFESHLIGTKSGDIKEFSIDFPESHHEKEIAGKKVNFRVIVKEIKQKILPEINNEFAKEVGDFETVEDLKKLISERLKEVKKEQVESDWQKQLLQSYKDQIEIDIPEKMVEKEIDQMLVEISYNLSQQGMNFEKYLEVTGKKPEEIRESLREDAKRRVKTQLVLEAISEKEGINVTKEEVDEEIKHLAERASKTPEEVEKMLRERNELGLLAYDVLLKKALSAFVDAFKEKVIEPEEKQKEKGKKKKTTSKKQKKATKKSKKSEKKPKSD